jgi:transposase, IS30 family
LSRPYRRFTPEELNEIWEHLGAGKSVRAIARSLSRAQWSVQARVAKSGGVRPRTPPPCSPRFLSLAEREEISRGLSAGESLRVIAGRLGRATSTIAREVGRNGGSQKYRASKAQTATHVRCRRPKVAKLARCPELRRAVEGKLLERWSPQQISAWLPREFPSDSEMRVSHETIYMSLFVQGRGALRKELHQCLRSGRATRRPQGRISKGKSRIKDMVMISERPAEAADRAVPGHWEGDLLEGKKPHAIATLVERSSRYVMLLALPTGHNAEVVREAIAKRIVTLPTELRRSLTWDQGGEMGQHLRFTVDTGVQVYFCDPHSPWQRGSNENTNGLLRQYFPKGHDISGFTQDQLNAVARQLNGRPRQTLGWRTPSEVLTDAVATIA